MRRNIKVLIVITISLAILILIYIGLVIKEILPNPFLDTSDLVCTRAIEFETYTEESVIIFVFDKKAKLKKYEITENMVYPTLEEAKEYYEYTKPYVNFLELIEEENKVKYFSSIKQNKDDSFHFSKTKKELKEEYEKNDSYICE